MSRCGPEGKVSGQSRDVSVREVGSVKTTITKTEWVRVYEAVRRSSAVCSLRSTRVSTRKM